MFGGRRTQSCASSGPGVFLGCLSFGSAFPSIEPTITAMAAAMWDTSAVVFLLFALLDRETGLSFGAHARPRPPLERERVLRSKRRWTGGFFFVRNTHTRASDAVDDIP